MSSPVLYAITPRGIGKEVGYRTITQSTALEPGEFIHIGELPSQDPVLANDQTSVRPKNPAERLQDKVEETARRAKEAADRDIKSYPKVLDVIVELTDKLLAVAPTAVKILPEAQAFRDLRDAIRARRLQQQQDEVPAP